MELHFYPYDFEYKVEEGKTFFYFYGRTKDGQKVAVKHEYQPFFYASALGLDKKKFEERVLKLSLKAGIEPAQVVRIESVEKDLLGKKQEFYKVYANYPKAVPLLAKEIQTWGISCYEKDILYAHRYLRDHNITPMKEVVATGNYIQSPWMRVPVFVADKVEQRKLEQLSDWRILAIDIETYAVKREIDSTKNPILMVALYGMGKGKDGEEKEFRKVITWKNADLPEYVEIVADEAELLRRMKEVILEFNPDILTGYFTDGFDFPYLQTRAQKFNVRFDLGIDHSEIIVTQGGFGDVQSKIKGYLHLDMLKFIRNIFGKDLDVETYSLDSVSRQLLNHQKHKVELDKLSQTWDNGHNLDSGSEKLAEFCAYNLHDSFLAYKLCEKLLPDMIEFTSIVGLPTFDVIRMRFSKLVESYILKRAVEFGVIAPNKPENTEISRRMDESIQGAFVYEPTPGLYKDVVVFDFRSLYPTIISAHNIGPEGLKCNCCADKPENRVPGKNEYWFCLREKKFLPAILEQLISRRGEIKKQIKEIKQKKEDPSLLEARSYALKTLANSFYGYLGFYAARWYSLESAASTTAYARNYITTTIAAAQEKGFRVVYGDSLTPERKIFITCPDKSIQLANIGEFIDENIHNPNITDYKTLAFDGEELIFSPIKRAIRHKYDSDKKGDILKFITTHGITKVTPQHSLYKYEKGAIKLANAAVLKEGDSLVSLTGAPRSERYGEGHIFDLASLSFGRMEEEIFFYTDNLKFPQKEGICPYCKNKVRLANHVFNKHGDRKTPKRGTVPKTHAWAGVHHAEGGKIPRYWTLTMELAWILGYFCAEGSASDVKTKSGSRKCLISFGSQDLTAIERVKKFFDNILGDNLKIITDFDTRINKHMHYYRVQRIPLVGLFAYGFGCGKGSAGKKVPDFIYSSEEKIRRAFLEGYLAGDGNKNKDKRYITHFIRFDTKSKDLACGLNYLLKSIYHGKNFFGKEIKHIGWRYRRDKPLISSLRVQGVRSFADERGNYCAAKIKEIKKERYSGYVYDLEVAEHHNFVDAEGLILVHNTDSMFMLLGDKTSVQAMKFMEEINETLPGQMELELEGHYPQGIFVGLKGGEKGSEKGAKKKYALLRKDGTLKITGFETVRRNWSPLSKEVQKKILELALQEKVQEALKYVKDTIKELRSGKVLLERLILKTQITRELSSYSSFAPHVKVAQEMKERGENVDAGTIVPFIIVRGKGLIRDRAKIPSDVKDGEYDAEYYVDHQLIPAVSSIFAVLGYTEEAVFKESSQTGLGKFF